jgi:hypothetical protein
MLGNARILVPSGSDNELNYRAGRSNATHAKMRVTSSARIVSMCRHTTSDDVEKELNVAILPYVKAT